MSAIAFSSDGRRALCCNGELRLVDLESARTLVRYSAPGSVPAVALLPDGNSAVYAHRDHSLRLIELERGSEMERFTGHQREADCLACSDDGRFLISGGFDADEAEDVVLVWDMEGGGSSRRPERIMNMVASLAVSSDSRHALTGTMDTTVYLWDLATGEEIHRCEGHSGNVLSVAFMPAGDRFVSGSGTDAYDEGLIKDLGVDNTVRLWDAASGREIGRAIGHEGNVLSVAASPDGRSVLSGGADKTVRLWAFAV